MTSDLINHPRFKSCYWDNDTFIVNIWEQLGGNILTFTGNTPDDAILEAMVWIDEQA